MGTGREGSDRSTKRVSSWAFSVKGLAFPARARVTARDRVRREVVSVIEPFLRLDWSGHGEGKHREDGEERGERVALFGAFELSAGPRSTTFLAGKKYGRLKGRPPETERNGTGCT